MYLGESAWAYILMNNSCETTIVLDDNNNETKKTNCVISGEEPEDSIIEALVY
jgi:hypothetical protein